MNFIFRWFGLSTESYGIDRISYLTEAKTVDTETWAEATKQIREHYITPERLAHLCDTIGYPSASKALRARLPTTKRARSGEIGEILTSEFLNAQPGPKVLVKRLRWKDGRNNPLRGDDIFACSSEAPDALRIVKGECKSAQSLSQSTLDDAVAKLKENDGRPAEHTASFIAEKLAQSNEPLADIIDQYLFGEGHHRDDRAPHRRSNPA